MAIAGTEDAVAVTRDHRGGAGIRHRTAGSEVNAGARRGYRGIIDHGGRDRRMSTPKSCRRQWSAAVPSFVTVPPASSATPAVAVPVPLVVMVPWLKRWRPLGHAQQCRIARR